MKLNSIKVILNPISGIYKVFILLLIIIWSLPSCRQKVAFTEDQKIADETNTTEWLAYGRTHSE
ncbi:MAG: hypothetical protein KAI99_19280, partial [Cyclobacteriaceae bacterium]|nr:hypothetical protein [Cyclobacteriaceae bacterium]